MQDLQNAMRAQAMMATQDRAHTRLGIVSGYDPATYSVKVQFPPDTSETGWIPLGALAVGNGWGIFAPPVLGDQIAVTFQDGDRDAGIAGLRLFDNVSPPVAVPGGEFWLLHQTGSALKFHNDGSVELITHANLSATVGGNLSATVTGTGTLQAASWDVKGSATFENDLTVNGSTVVKAITSNGHDISSTHKHTGVQTGASVSGPPQ